MASTLYLFEKRVMIEKQLINGKEVWLKVDPYHVYRSNPNIIPTEYFTAAYFLQEPASESSNGEMIKGEDGEPMLFESPVEALTAARKSLEGRVEAR
jgi:hypothetical protein